MIKVLTLMSKLFEDEFNLPYSFDKWDVDLTLPHWVGEISENPNLNEDGKSEYSFILTGFGMNYEYLFGVVEDIKKFFVNGYITKSCVINYDRAITIPSELNNLKQVQVNFTIKDWSVE